MTKRKSYDKEFKLEAVQLVQSGKRVAEVARELDLAEQTLHNWVKKFSQDGKLTFEVMAAIMSEEKKGEIEKVTLTGDKLKKYFPKTYTPQQMEETIIKLLETWSRKRQQFLER